MRKVTATVDWDQTDSSDRDRLVDCPVCGQKLTEVVSVFAKAVMRQKCRRCGKYIKISAISEED